MAALIREISLAQAPAGIRRLGRHVGTRQVPANRLSLASQPSVGILERR